MKETEKVQPEAKLNNEITEDDLEQVSGGTDSINDKTHGVQKDKQATAIKNAAAVKALL